MTPRVPLPPQLHAAPFSVEAGRIGGLSKGRMRGPDLAAPFRGVRAASATESLAELCDAYRQRMHASAFFCGPTAAQILGIPLPRRFESSAILHVAVPSPKRAPSGKRIHGSAVRVAAHDIRQWNGLRISSPERVWCELAELLTVPDLVAAGDFLVQWRMPLTTRAGLENAVRDYPGRRGRATIREALPHLDERSESRPESIVRVALAMGGVVGLVPNLPVTTSAGYRHRIDLAIPSRKVAMEYQGGYHNDARQFAADLTRRSRLEADGWYVIFIGAGELENPAELLQRVQTVLASRPHFA
jgi:hypothetical protein